MNPQWHVYAIFSLALPPHSLPHPWRGFGTVVMRMMLPSGVGKGVAGPSALLDLARLLSGVHGSVWGPWGCSRPSS